MIDQGSKALELQALFDIENAGQCFDELLKRTCRQHDRVSAPAYIFSNLQKPSPLILFEV